MMGIEWMRRHLGDKYNIHILSFFDESPMHIDATLVFLRPGLILSNPERPCQQEEFFTKKGWKIVKAARPAINESHHLYFTSKWLNMNILMIDENRVLIDPDEKPLQKVRNFYPELFLELIQSKSRKYIILTLFSEVQSRILLKPFDYYYSFK